VGASRLHSAHGYGQASTGVLDMYVEGLSYRLIGRNVRLSKNTVMEIVRRAQ
jgi:DNA-directed RNA polymerase specialized sigma24 family protein